MWKGLWLVWGGGVCTDFQERRIKICSRHWELYSTELKWKLHWIYLCFLQVMCWFVAIIQKDELIVRRVYFLCAMFPRSSGQGEALVVNFMFPLGSSLAYAVTVRALTAVVVFSSWAAEAGFEKWLRSSGWSLCFQAAGTVPRSWEMQVNLQFSFSPSVIPYAASKWFFRWMLLTYSIM